MGRLAFISATFQRVRAVLNAGHSDPQTNQHGDDHRGHSTKPEVPVEAADEPSAGEAAAGQAHDRRDIDGEFAPLIAAVRELRAQPWFPIQPGDVVCWSIDRPGGRHGETLIAVKDPGWAAEAGTPLQKMSETPYETVGSVEIELDDDAQSDDQSGQGRAPHYEDFYDIWFEAGPANIAVIRHGQLVHGTVRATPVPTNS